MKQKINNEPINQELLEILTKYYDGSFARLVQQIRHSNVLKISWYDASDRVKAC